MFPFNEYEKLFHANDSTFAPYKTAQTSAEIAADIEGDSQTAQKLETQNEKPAAVELEFSQLNGQGTEGEGD